MNNEIFSKTNKQKEKQLSTEHSYLLIEYLSMNICNENLAFSSVGLLSAYLIYQKLSDNFIAKWQVTLYPIYIFFIIKVILSFYFIIQNEDDNQNCVKRIKVINIMHIRLISNFFRLILYCLGIICLYNLQEFLDQRNDEYLFGFLYIIIAICIWGILYSLIRKFSFFSFSEITVSSSSYSLIGIILSFLNPLMTSLSNLTIFCSGGACTQIYVSTITSLFGAFGITLSHISQYLFPITCVLVFVSLFSLFIKRKRWTHKPFLLGVLSALLILLGKYYDKSIWKFMIYLGNLLMIIAAVWNARLNKFSGLPI